MDKIIRVKSNIKSPKGEEWSYELDDLNLLIGPNESGKSAVAEAVQLAATGSAYGLFFRDSQVKSGPQLGKLATTEEDIYAEVEYSDGTSSRWEMVKGGRPKRTGEKITALPIAELRDALSGSATRARHFFAPLLLPDTFSRESLEKLLPNKEIDLSVPLEKLLPDYGDPLSVQDIILAYKNCGSWKRSANSKAKAVTNMLPFFDHPDPVAALKLSTELAWDMQLAIKFEWLKKLYKSQDFEEDDKVVLGKLALEIGDQETLRSLRGSAEYFDDLSKVWKTTVTAEIAHKSRKKIKAFEEEAKSFETLEKALDVALTMLLAPEITKYCRRVNKFLPKGDKFGVKHDLKNFSVFLSRNGEEHFALSGSTEARVLAAMGAALATGGKPTMLVVDDRMWDSKTLAKTMERLETSKETMPFQAILMSTLKPRGRARAKWNYVEIKPKGYDAEDEEPQEQAQDAPPENPLEEAGK